MAGFQAEIRTSITTHGISPAEAGERLLANLVPYYAGIDTELAALSELGEKPLERLPVCPAGFLKIVATERGLLHKRCSSTAW